ncbi:MAG: glycosyltransferase family 2 protein [Paracoccaceae bacterium]|nr:glycosyltransferase family 2 protein [Paracoccaceae bacterium]
MSETLDTGLAGESKSAARKRPTISLIIPVHNEQAAIEPFLTAVDDALAVLAADYRFKFVFVNDGSTDSTEQIIARIAVERPDICLLNLSRNFGKEAALAAGLFRAESAAVIPIDVDLQDPPTLIPKMIERWQSGAKIVNARRSNRGSDSWLKRVSAKGFYRVFNLLADYPIPSDVGDFRLLDREVVQVIRELGERSRFNKALFSWVGYETDEVSYVRPARESGSTAWSYWRLWKLALDGIFASSTTPLRIWTYIGMSLALASFLYSLFIFTRAIAFGVDTPGYASTVILILTFGGLNMFALGIIGEYVGRIYAEVRQRPLYVVRSIIDSDEDSANGS